MPRQKPVRPTESPRREPSSKGNVSPALTSRDLMAVARERLAMRGFDWGDALRTGRGPAGAGREEPR